MIMFDFTKFEKWKKKLENAGYKVLFQDPYSIKINIEKEPEKEEKDPWGLIP